MKVYGVSAYDVDTVVWDVSRHRYNGNLILKSIADCSNTRGPRATFTLRVLDSRAGQPGAVGSATRQGTGPNGLGRRLGACWHAHWDVIEELFRRYPNARITSGFRMRNVRVVYTADSFRQTALATAHLPMGYRHSPTTLPRCCECDHSLYTDVPPTPDLSLLDEPIRQTTQQSTQRARHTRTHTGTHRENLDRTDRGSLDYQPWDGWQPSTVGYGANSFSPNPHGNYPLDVIKPAQPWTPRVKPGSDTVDDTLGQIDKLLAE